jgi:hypothetical protein
MRGEEFRKFLKKSGKKDHVIDELIAQVRAFEAWLAGGRKTGLVAATGKDIREHVKTLTPRDVKMRMRGLALYYQCAGNHVLSKLASGIREQGIAKTRKAFKLREFRGVKAKEIAKLEAIGIVTVGQMLSAGKTPQARKQLAKRTGIPPAVILELVKLSDISRVGAIRSVRARLYYDAGLDTPVKFTKWEPEALRRMLLDFVKRTGFKGIAPLPKELRNAIQNARRLPKMIQY